MTATKTWCDPHSVHEDFRWAAWHSSTNFEPDSPEKTLVGYGRTEAAARADLARLEEELHELKSFMQSFKAR